jgi:hypothetical protein
LRHAVQAFVVGRPERLLDAERLICRDRLAAVERLFQNALARRVCENNGGRRSVHLHPYSRRAEHELVRLFTELEGRRRPLPSDDELRLLRQRISRSARHSDRSVVAHVQPQQAALNLERDASVVLRKRLNRKRRSQGKRNGQPRDK